MRNFFFPDHIYIQLSLAPALQKTLDEVVAQQSAGPRIQAAADRLNAVTEKLGAAVEANPDPDKTD